MGDTSIPHKLQKFLGDQYTEINQAAIFEEPGRITFDNSGNRPKLTFSMTTGQFIEGFGEWYAQNRLAPVFGNENVVCEKDGTPHSGGSRDFVFSIFGELQELLSKVEEWEHAGIDPSADNNAQLLELLKKIVEDKVNDQEISAFMGGLISDDSAVIEFSPGIPYQNDIIPEELQGLKTYLAEIFSLKSGIGFFLDDKKGIFTQIIIELEHLSSLDLLRRASRSGVRLEEGAEKPIHVEECAPNGI